MSPQPNPSIASAAHVLKGTPWLLATLILCLAPAARAEETRESLAQRDVQASVLFDQGKFAEAEKEQRAVLALRAQLLGPEDAHTLMSRNNLACCGGNEAGTRG